MKPRQRQRGKPQPARGNKMSCRPFRLGKDTGPGGNMRAILLWLLGIPIPVIILLYLFGVLG
jgi:hypothetical protein